MKVRPIYWYVLSGVLSLALLLGAGSHWQEMSELRQGKSAVNGQEYLQTAEKTDTAHFLDDLAYQAEGLNAELVLFTTEKLPENGGYGCQITALGAYNDLAELLGWLESQTCVTEIRQFALKNDQDNTMQLVVNLLLE